MELKQETNSAEFVSVLSALGAIGWREVTIRDVLNAVPMLYGKNRKGLHSRDEAARRREDFYKLRDKHREQLATAESGKIVSHIQVTAAKVEKCRGEVLCARSDVDNLSCELGASRNASLA